MVSGMKPAAIARLATGHRKLPPPWPKSKRTPRLPRLQHVRLNFATEAVDQFDLPIVVHVCVNVSGTQVVQQFLPSGAAGVGLNPVIHHHRNLRQSAGRNGAIDGGPSRSAEVSRLDANDVIAIGLDRRCRPLGVHIFRVAFGRRPDHAFADDVDQRQNARLGVEMTVPRNSSNVRQPLPPASTTVVVPAGRAVSSGKMDPFIAEHMSMKVDEAGHDVQARNIHVLLRIGSRDMRLNRGDLRSGDCPRP